MLLLLAVRARKVSALGAMMKGKWWPMAGMLRLCIVTIVATPLNFSHEEKAVTVRSHGVEHAVDLLAGRYRQSCRRLLVERSQVTAGALVQL